MSATAALTTEATDPASGLVMHADNITIKFGGLVAVNDVSFTIPAGTTAAFIGATGSGKSTLVSLLPRLHDRPLTLQRFPDGIDGKSFYQKDAPDWSPDWIRTVTVWSESSDRSLDYFVAEDVETLLYLANLGTIPLHIWHSRVDALERPDWCLIDLDPKNAPFAHVVEAAAFLHELCGEIGLPHYVKTTGSTCGGTIRTLSVMRASLSGRANRRRP